VTEERETSAREATPTSDRQPYVIHEDALFSTLEKMDVQRLIDECDDPWYNQTLCQVNDSVVRLGVLQGEYHWHKHDNQDEFFLVLDGLFRIEMEDRIVELQPRQAFTVPKGVLHRPVVPVRTTVIMIEGAGVKPTGD
jgi:mannose-6-phosphate isomerase-like protein (cupin superfamily)